MWSIYGVFVLLVLLIVTLTATYPDYNGFSVNQIMGYVGIATIGALIVAVAVFKLYLLEYMTNTVKSLKVEGYSEFNMVYNKTKELNDVEIPELQKIEQIIESNPIDFRRCFPNANLNSTLKIVKETIATKIHQKNSARMRNAE